MHQNDLNKARSLVQQSKILSAVEKTEWLQLLPLMNNQQVSELVKILENPKSNDVLKLNPVQGLPIKKEEHLPDQNKFLLPDITEKELAAGIPANELKLPAHATNQKTAPAKKEASPADIARIIENLKTPKAVQKDVVNHSNAPLHSAVNNSNVPPVPLPPVPHPPVSASSIKTELKSKAVSAAADIPAHNLHQKILEFKLSAPEDLQKISAAVLHGSDPYEIFQKIVDFIAASSKNSNTISMIEFLQQSSLHQTYVKTGIELLNDQSEDREAVYKNIAERAKQSGSDYMTKDEFEAYVDFRKELDKIYVI